MVVEPSRPRSPRKTADERKLRRQQMNRARDQFAALGQFIQAFEQVVDLLRSDCVRFTAGWNRGITTANLKNPSLMSVHERICMIVFNHKAMTAMPILELWRVIMQLSLFAIPELPESEREIIREIISQISTSFHSIIDSRNQIVHATWWIGHWWLTISEEEEFHAEKIVITGKDFRRAALPKSRVKFTAMIDQCNAIYLIAQGLRRCFHDPAHYKPSSLFEKYIDTGKKPKYALVTKNVSRKTPKASQRKSH